MQFDLQFRFIEKSTYGSNFISRENNSLVDALRNGQIDVTASLLGMYNSVSYKYLDYSYPIVYFSFNFLVNNSKKKSADFGWFRPFVRGFSGNVWISFIISAVIIFLVTNVRHRMFPYQTFKALMVTVSCLEFCLTVYDSVLVADIASYSEPLGFKNMDELIDVVIDKRYSLFLKRADFDFYQSPLFFPDEQKRMKLQQLEKSGHIKLYDSIEEALNMVTSTPQSVTSAPAHEVHAVSMKNCDTKIVVDSSPTTYWLAVAFPKNSKIFEQVKEKLNLEIMKYFERSASLIKRYEQLTEVSAGNTKCTAARQNYIRFNQFLDVIYLYVFAHCLSIVLLLVECYSYYLLQFYYY